MASKTILVTGATGKQGGATIKALLSTQPTPPFKILALTRNTTSAGAKALAAKPNVTVIEGNLDDCSAIFEKADTTIWGVFSVQVPMGSGASPETEEKQGKALVDAAVANNVSHFVYASVDRGGTEKSDAEATDVPHFVSKYRIEKYLLEKAAGSKQGMTWTILRPTAFFDNLVPGMMGKVFGAVFSTMKKGKKLQYISCRDIGIFAARAFNEPEEWKNQSVSLAGDDLTFEEMNAVFKKEIGTDMPATYQFVGTAVKWGVKEMGLMFNWFEKEGYGADIQALRKTEPSLQDFGTWLRDSSAFVTR